MASWHAQSLQLTTAHDSHDSPDTWVFSEPRDGCADLELALKNVELDGLAVHVEELESQVAEV